MFLAVLQPVEGSLAGLQSAQSEGLMNRSTSVSIQPIEAVPSQTTVTFEPARQGHFPFLYILYLHLGHSFAVKQVKFDFVWCLYSSLAVSRWLKGHLLVLNQLRVRAS